MYVPVSAHESSFAPTFVCILKIRAINPSRISVTRLIVINKENRDSFLINNRYMMKGKITILYKDSIFGMVQNRSVVARLLIFDSVFLQYNE
jgi:hypothetical protein